MRMQPREPERKKNSVLTASVNVKDVQLSVMHGQLTSSLILSCECKSPVSSSDAESLKQSKLPKKQIDPESIVY